MPRPAPTVLISHTDHQTGRLTEIITGEGMYFITYRGGIFNLKITNAYTEVAAKYLKVAYPNRAHALRLAEKLNQQFNCRDFSVTEVGGTPVSDKPDAPKEEPKEPKMPYNDIARKLLEATRQPRAAPVIVSVKSLRAKNDNK